MKNISNTKYNTSVTFFQTFNVTSLQMNDHLYMDVLKQLPEYVLDKKIKSTNFSCVMLCKNSQGEEVVVKLCNTSTVDDHTRELIKGEAESLAKLQHPNILRFITSLEIDKFFIIVTEYANRGDLLAQIAFAKQKKGTAEERIFLKPVMINSIIGQICRALSYVHQSGYMHRDIKPANVLLMQANKSMKYLAKLCDFGIARQLKENEYAKTMTGTPDYAAPEVIMGKPYTNKCDMWSMGIMLFELTNLSMPFGKELISTTITEDESQIKLPEIKFVDGNVCTEEHKNIIINLLVLNVEHRKTAQWILEQTQMKKVLEKVDQQK